MLGGAGGKGMEREGVELHVMFEAAPPLLMEKKTLFSHKESQHGKLQRIMSNLKNLYEIATCGLVSKGQSHLETPQSQCILQTYDNLY